VGELDPRVQKDIESALKTGEERSIYAESLYEWEREGIGRKLLIGSGNNYTFIGLSLPQSVHPDNTMHVILLTNFNLLITSADSKKPDLVKIYKEHLDPNPKSLSWPSEDYPNIESVEEYLRSDSNLYNGKVTREGDQARFPLIKRTAIEVARELKRRSQRSSSNALMVRKPQGIEEHPVNWIDSKFDAEHYMKIWPR
jgi:hypothetical protein